MQGMIMHHAQAVEMTALIESHTENKDLRLLGARISNSQSDEMEFMKRWLEIRGEPLYRRCPRTCQAWICQGMDMSSHHHDAHARDAYAEADGRLKKSKGRGV